MKLSVVIPVYNGADFIEKSYNTIIDQNIADFEILYVNNNSKDDSVKRIQLLVDKDVRVHLLHQPKQGTSRARNMGILNAKGDYVYVFDVDDEIYPNALHKMIQVLDTYPETDAVFGKMIKSYKSISETTKPDDETDDIVFKDKPYWGLFWFENLKHVVGPPAFLYKKRVFDTIGVYHEGIINTEDTAFDIKLGMTCNVAFLDTYVYLYYKHAVSTIQQAKKHEDLVSLHWTRFTKSHLPFYLEHDVPLRYKALLYAYFYKTIGKIITGIPSYSERRVRLQTLLTEIKPVKLPYLLVFYLKLLTVFPLSVFLKLYVYYLVPFYIKHYIAKL